MNKIIVIGSPGSGKSVFSRELNRITGIPLYHLDMINWRDDKTTIPRERFIEEIKKIGATDRWIIDGNYDSTMELRMSLCDTVFFLDYPTDVCYEGIMQRRGTDRPDMPWVESDDGIDEEFVKFVLQYNTVNRPVVMERLQRYSDREIHIFKNRAEASAFLDGINGINITRRG